MKWHIFNQGKRQRGAAVVEFALVVPLLLLLFFGIIEFSLLVYNKHIITNASREAARYGIVFDNTHRVRSKIKDVVIDWVSDAGEGFLVTFGTDTFTGSNITVDVYHAADNKWYKEADGPILNIPVEFGDKLRVTVKYDYDFLLIPSFLSSLAGGKTITAETIMNFE